MGWVVAGAVAVGIAVFAARSRTSRRVDRLREHDAGDARSIDDLRTQRDAQAWRFRQ